MPSPAEADHQGFSVTHGSREGDFPARWASLACPFCGEGRPNEVVSYTWNASQGLGGGRHARVWRVGEGQNCPVPVRGHFTGTRLPSAALALRKLDFQYTVYSDEHPKN